MSIKGRLQKNKGQFFSTFPNSVKINTFLRIILGLGVPQPLLPLLFFHPRNLSPARRATPLILIEPVARLFASVDQVNLLNPPIRSVYIYKESGGVDHKMLEPWLESTPVFGL